VPRPDGWGGYVLTPDHWEFWNQRPDRLHDRFVYEPDGAGGWTITRLWP
jgi:pyridoxamine 5'-phosphate oxidase